MTDAEALDQALKAKAILESPVYQKAYENCRAAIITLMEKAPLSDTQGAEDLRRCLKLLRDVRSNMEAMMKSGVIVEFKLAEEKRRKDNPLRGFFR